MNYFRFFLANKPILLFGVLLVFFSNFGQTFLLSLYIPSLLESFNISRSGFSSLYAVATLLSAGTLIVVGRKIDYVPLRGFTLFVVGGIIAACLLAAFSYHIVTLFFAIYLLRFFGQGLLSHTSMTTMARFFSKARGKALSIAYLGFPLGEGVLPVLIVGAIMLFGWRETMGLSAVFILLVLLPLSMIFLRASARQPIREPRETAPQTPAKIKGDARLWKHREIIKSRAFFLFAPTVFLAGFLLTALFFFQTFIAEEKGWPLEWMAAGIAAFAISASLCSLFAGPLIDRFTALKLFPLILLPLGAGLITLGVVSQPVFIPAYWLLVGITGGVSSPITSALYAETFGTRSLGTVRSLFTFVMVASTAAAPVGYSFFLERGFSFVQIHWGVIGILLLNFLFIKGMGKLPD